MAHRQILRTTPIACCLLLLAAEAFSPTILYPQQAPGPDEIRVSSQPYAPHSPYTLRAEAKLVDLVVAVRDGHGRAVHSLQKSDFQIYDDGKDRPISTFSEDPAASGGIAVPSAIAPSPTAPVAVPAAKTQPARFLA